jgi:hypothetical protein
MAALEIKERRAVSLENGFYIETHYRVTRRLKKSKKARGAFHFGLDVDRAEHEVAQMAELGLEPVLQQQVLIYSPWTTTRRDDAV